MKLRTFILFIFLISTFILHAQWQQTSGPGGGDVGAVYSDGNSVYLSTGVGVFKSENGGALWTPANNGLTEPVKAVTKSNGVLFTVTKDEVYRSPDEGLSWQKLSLNSPESLFSIYATDDVIFVSGVISYRSLDGGDTWEQLNNPYKNFTAVGSVFFAIHSGGVHETTNFGTDWLPVALLPSGVAADLTYTGTRLLAMTSRQVFSSQDNGQSWSLLFDLAGQSGSLRGIGHDDGVPIVATFYDVFRYSDITNDWSEITGNFPGNFSFPRNITSHQGSVFMSSLNGLFHSDGSGTDWVEQNNGLATTIVNCFWVNQDQLWTGTSFAGAYQTTDLGDTWTSTAADIGEEAGILNLQNFGDRVYASVPWSSGNLWVSPDFGLNWNIVGEGIFDNISTVVEIGNQFYAGGAGGIFISDNGLTNWERSLEGLIIQQPDHSHPDYIRAIIETDIGIIAGSYGRIYLSENQGATWEIMNQPGASDFAYHNDILYAISGSDLLRSHDHGRTWESFLNGTPDSFATAFTVRLGKLYAAMPSGIYIMAGDDSEWILEAAPLPISTGARTMLFYKDFLFAGTQGGGVWKYFLPDISDVSEKDFDNSLKVFPNPFESHISIKNSDIGEKSELTVYNSMGQVVDYQVLTTLDSETVVNLEGNKSGVYFLEIKNSFVRSIKKIIKK